MNGIILYSSRYGATKRYADWLAEATGFDCAEVGAARVDSLRPYDTVVFGGGVYASSIAGLSFLKKHIDQLKGKKLVVFCDGASPYDEKAFRQIVEHNLKGELAGLECFYCRGALDYERMSFVDRNLCKLLRRAVAKKKPEDREPLEQALMEAGFERRDWTDRASLEPILAALRQHAALSTLQTIPDPERS